MTPGQRRRYQDDHAAGVNRSRPMRLGFIVVVAFVSVLTLLGSACQPDRLAQDEEPHPQALPVATAPPILRETALPQDTQRLSSLWSQLLKRVAGRDLLVMNTDGSSGFDAQYGEANGLTGQPRLRLKAQDMRVTFGYLGLTTGATTVTEEFQRASEDNGPFSGGQDGSLFWVYRPSVGVSLIWAADDSPWVFLAVAPTIDQMEELMIALHEALIGSCRHAHSRHHAPV